jgi:hypothetical protein
LEIHQNVMLKPMLKRSLHLLISLFIVITIYIGEKTTSVSSVNETSTVLYFPIIAHEGLTLPETAAWIGPGGVGERLQI